MSKKLFLNSLSGTTLYVVNVIIAFIMSPIYIKALGNVDYGLWELVLSVVGYMGLIDLGMGGSLVRFVSIADGRQDKHDFQQIISTAYVFFVPAGVVSFILFLLFSLSPEIIAGEEIRDIANIKTVFILLGVNAGLLFPMQIFTATLTGMQRHYFLNSVRIILLIGRSIISYFLIIRYPDDGLLILALLEPCYTLIQFVLFSGVVFFDKNIPRFSWSSVSWRKTKEIITFSMKSAIMRIASRLQSLSVPFIIGHVIGLGHIVYFVMPNRLIDYAKGLSLTIGFPLVPYFGSTIGGGSKKLLQSSWLSTTLVLQIVSLAMPIMVFFCGETFLELWIGPEYSNAGRFVLYVLLVGLVADGFATNAYNILTAQGKHGKIALMWLVFSVLSIPLGVGGGYLWGVTGVAAGTTIATVLGSLFTLTMACAVMQISRIAYLRKTFFRILPALLLLSLSLFIFKNIFHEKNYVNLFYQVGLSSFFYIIAIWFFSFPLLVRKNLLAKIEKSLKKNKKV